VLIKSDVKKTTIQRILPLDTNMKTLCINNGFCSLQHNVASFSDTMTDAPADKNKDFYK